MLWETQGVSWHCLWELSPSQPESFSVSLFAPFWVPCSTFPSPAHPTRCSGAPFSPSSRTFLPLIPSWCWVPAPHSWLLAHPSGLFIPRLRHLDFPSDLDHFLKLQSPSGEELQPGEEEGNVLTLHHIMSHGEARREPGGGCCLTAPGDKGRTPLSERGHGTVPHCSHFPTPRWQHGKLEFLQHSERARREGTLRVPPRFAHGEDTASCCHHYGHTQSTWEPNASPGWADPAQRQPPLQHHPNTAVPGGWMTAGREARSQEGCHSLKMLTASSEEKEDPSSSISAQSPLEQLSPHLRHQHEPHGPCERVATLPEPGGSTEPRTKKHPTSGCRAQSHHRPVKTSAPQQVKRSPRTTARASPHRRCSYSKAG